MWRSVIRDPVPPRAFSSAPHLPIENGHHRSIIPVTRCIAGNWCELRIDGVPPGTNYILIIRPELPVAPKDSWAASIVMHAQGNAKPVIFFVPNDAIALHVSSFGLPRANKLLVHAKKISRLSAGWKLVSNSPSRSLELFRAQPGTAKQRLRSLLVSLAAGKERWLDYATWLQAFDCWSEEDRHELFASPERPHWPNIGLLVDLGGPAEAIKATSAALRGQWLPAASSSVEPDTLTLADILVERTEDYLAVIQAGEILPPHALSVFADQAAKAGLPPALYADEDEIGPDFQRTNPHFKPETGPLLLSSGVLTRGIWMFRRATIEEFGTMPVKSANALRLGLALRLTNQGEQTRIIHIPFVLMHRRFDTLRGSGKDLVPAVEQFMSERKFPANIKADSLPLQIKPRIGGVQSGGSAPKVSIIIPSTARARHVATCLDGVLQQTRYPNFEVVIVVSQTDPLDIVQEGLLAPLLARGNVRVRWLRSKSFSFARATNFGVTASTSAFICLLNDDVVPLQDDWLSILVAHLNDRKVGIVGPKLLYPDNTVQHGGVIMGLGGGCGHAHRFLPKDAPGYAFRALLDQDFCCVTGACMLVRRDLYETLGGLDEAYPIAFNDIDFCLRAREVGWRVVYAASATLLHYETISLGSHYAGDRDGLQTQELGRLLERWAGPVAADPFHNPNLSLEMGHEWDPELPPRITKPFGFRRVAGLP